MHIFSSAQPAYVFWERLCFLMWTSHCLQDTGSHCKPKSYSLFPLKRKQARTYLNQLGLTAQNMHILVWDPYQDHWWRKIGTLFLEPDLSSGPWVWGSSGSQKQRAGRMAGEDTQDPPSNMCEGENKWGNGTTSTCPKCFFSLWNV